MATKRISELSLRSNFDATCNVPVDDSTQSFRTTGQQIRDFIAPLTTIGDLLFATTAGVAARLAIGSAQQILRPVAGVPAWSWPFAVQRSASTTDSINATTDHILLYDATSAAFTATLPTAASVAGKTYILKKTDSSFNAVTIATTSSQTIDGVVGTTLNTQNEILVVFSDGSNWQVLQRIIPSGWTSYTPTFTGFGTCTNVGFWWRRRGTDIEVRGTFTTGTTTATEARLSLPSGLTTDSNIGTLQLMPGPLGRNISSSTFFFVQAAVEASKTYFVFTAQQSTTDNMTKRNGNASFGNSENTSFYAMAPISGWKS